MKLSVKGKYMDTAPIRGVFRQGEERADEITIELPPRYGEHDLAPLRWVIRGRDGSGYTAEQDLPVREEDGRPLLTWIVASPFTNLSGDVRLELSGHSPDGEVVLKLGGDSIYIAPGLAGTAPPETLDGVLARLLALEQAIRRNGEGNLYLADDGQYKPIMGVSPARYRKRFTEADFAPRLTRWRLLIPSGEHKLGTAVFVQDCLREDNGSYGNILYQYHITPDGSVEILSDEAFAGEIIIDGK